MKIIDLSQEIYTGMPIFPAHIKTICFPYETHEDTAAMGFKYTFKAGALLISEHGGTHVDGFNEYGTSPEDKSIDQIPLEWFITEGICLDVSHVPPKEYITPRDLEEALKKSGQEIKKGDTVLLYTGDYTRNYPRRAYLEEYPGLNREATLWLADKGAINIGVDSPSIDNPVDMECSAHKVCVERKILNTENMANLDKVVNKRFKYIGLPLKIRGGTGSPIRAIAILEEQEH